MSLMNRDDIRLLKQLINAMGEILQEYDLLKGATYEYLNKCYIKHVLPDKETLSRLINEQLRKEVEEWQVRKND